MAKDALERLFEDSLNSSDTQMDYSIDEQLDFEENNFLDSIGTDAKNTLDSRIEKLELENEPVVIEEEPTQVEEEPVKRGRGRPRKDASTEPKEVETKATPVKNENVKYLDMNEFMDSLSIDLLNELKDSNYVTRNFSRSQMLVIINYIMNKI